MVIGVASVMMFLVLASYMYFRSNAGTAIFRRDRLMAAYAAESGANLAMHHLRALDRLPLEPFDPFPDGFTMPEGSSARITVHPSEPVNPAVGNGIAEIRSLGSYRSQDYRLIVRAVPRYLSGFALVADGDIPPGFFTDGSVVDGHVHGNGRVFFDSSSPDSTDDPWVSAVSTTAAGGFIFSDAGLSDSPHPPNSRVWVRPWPRHNQGRPTWSSSQEPVDMQRASLELSELVGGAVMVTAARMLLDGSRVIYRRDTFSPPETLSLAGVSVLCVSGGYDGTILKSRAGLTAPLTIISRGNLVLGGSIDGGLAGHGGPLGLVAMGDIIVETDPEFTGQDDWDRPWDIETDSHMSIRAFMAAPRGRFRARTSMYPPELTRISIQGGLAVGTFSGFGTGLSGFELGISHDPGLVSLHPPGFPQVWKWTPVSWLMDAPREAFEE
jgi:hypothetical protein